MHKISLNELEELILETLADESEKNPTTSLTGIHRRSLQAKVGLPYRSHVTHAVAKLQGLGFVTYQSPNVIITQKGIDYVKWHKKQWNKSPKRFGKIFWVVLVLVILLGMGLIIPTQDARMLIVSVVAGLIVWGGQVLYNHYGRSN